MFMVAYVDRLDNVFQRVGWIENMSHYTTVVC